MSFELPSPLGEYFAAANARDAERVANCFAEDAVVRDERQEIRGRDAIRGWAEETGRKYNYRAEILGFQKDPDRVNVRARLTGDFPGSPVELSYRFKLLDRWIQGLEIS
jgi:ketosteroid isomerase-like protein